jgi:thiol-disulfide isomerase/thioredoxin
MPRPSLQTSLTVFAIFVILAFLLYFFFYKVEKFDSMATITYYYLPTCGWCQKFSPTWDEFVKTVEEKKIAVKTRKLDASSNEAKEEVAKYDIQGFPHVQFVKGDTVVAYNGDRTVNDLVQFVQSNL